MAKRGKRARRVHREGNPKVDGKSFFSALSSAINEQIDAEEEQRAWGFEVDIPNAIPLELIDPLWMAFYGLSTAGPEDIMGYLSDRLRDTEVSFGPDYDERVRFSELIHGGRNRQREAAYSELEELDEDAPERVYVRDYLDLEDFKNVIAGSHFPVEPGTPEMIVRLGQRRLDIEEAGDDGYGHSNFPGEDYSEEEMDFLRGLVLQADPEFLEGELAEEAQERLRELSQMMMEELYREDNPTGGSRMSRGKSRRKKNVVEVKPKHLGRDITGMTFSMMEKPKKWKHKRLTPQDAILLQTVKDITQDKNILDAFREELAQPPAIEYLDPNVPWIADLRESIKRRPRSMPQPTTIDAVVKGATEEMSNEDLETVMEVMQEDEFWPGIDEWLRKLIRRGFRPSRFSNPKKDNYPDYNLFPLESTYESGITMDPYVSEEEQRTFGPWAMGPTVFEQEAEEDFSSMLESAGLVEDDAKTIASVAKEEEFSSMFSIDSTWKNIMKGLRHTDSIQVLKRGKKKRVDNPKVSFKTKKMNKAQKEALFEAERNLWAAGLYFDTDYGFKDGTRNWMLDWSIKGPMEIIIREGEWDEKGTKGKVTFEPSRESNPKLRRSQLIDLLQELEESGSISREAMVDEVIQAGLESGATVQQMKEVLEQEDPLLDVTAYPQGGIRFPRNSTYSEMEATLENILYEGVDAPPSFLQIEVLDASGRDPISTALLPVTHGNFTFENYLNDIRGLGDDEDVAALGFETRGEDVSLFQVSAADPFLGSLSFVIAGENIENALLNAYGDDVILSPGDRSFFVPDEEETMEYRDVTRNVHEMLSSIEDLAGEESSALSRMLNERMEHIERQNQAASELASMLEEKLFD